MNRGVIALLLAAFVFATPSSAHTRHGHHAHHRAIHVHSDANGNVVSHKTGAHATVGVRYAAKFQAYIDRIEAAGARVLFMGGIRHGRCSSGHQHPCGMALDVCQLRRDRVDGRCGLPGRHALARIAASVGLFEGGQWCHGDYGHAQVEASAPACGTMMAARSHRHHGSRQITSSPQPAAPDRFDIGNV